ncbi:C-terminal novel E3 ligase, LRR-interacting [Pseudomonas sp. NFACC15-1]|uniref:NEL-type E3 ubiquitin ligase domain-containing protein n=1 Tax=unclassified Pseudomonas TaxID=196821 RepID=UPI00087ECA8C|nr:MULTISPECIES: NEL-type E3 ubiquitin ligase domain-containing protein [unclassified Pseudomonas]SDA93168.1 C-terminal novel E3 ligase, LRR-interacting [Pseudomonas sp. NFACC15-1]SDY60212.1 C-terminal novel E3 ligase, LRR-interacting [Pseudomonas sp. NFACC14]
MPGFTPRLATPQGEHFDLLKARIPGWYSGAIVQRQQELSDHELTLPDWYAKASPDLWNSLKDSHSRYRERLNQVDNRLGNIQDIRAFAEPLLEQALLDEFNLTLNVNEVYFVRQYGRRTRDDFFGALVLDSEGGHFDRYEYRGTSLLEAALANFAPEEARKPACADCSLITTVRPFQGGAVVPSVDAVRAGALPIASEAFAQLCRTLDLGRQYQEHINAVLRLDDSKTYNPLDHSLEEHHRQGLALNIEIARAKADISPAVYAMLQRVIDGASDVTLDGQAVTFTSLKVFDIDLVGPLLIGPDLESSRRVVPVVAYLPGDPEHPLKAYASSADFMVELRRRLHGSTYRRFFSRFVPLRQQGVFFRQFKHFYQTSPTADDQADYPLKSSLRNLPMATAPIPGDLWGSLRLRQIEKIQADARAVAVPTGDEDQKARLARLDSYLDAVVDVFNLAAFVVPGLGPLMLTVGAVQMFNEAFEGIEAFERGETQEMWAHFSSVALNTAFVATGAAVLPHIRWSGAVDQLEPVQLANGESRLWRPDLSVYQSELAPPPASSPDTQGLYRVGDRQVLPLGDRYYEVQQDPQTLRYRIRHPSRPQAYQPELTGNGNGAWHHELEQPRSWEGPTLMRRLGHGVKDFSDAELERIRLASATPQDVLRRVHVEGEPVPALLADTLDRFDLCRQLDTFIGQLQSEEPLGHDLAEPMLHLLSQYGPWPRGLKLKVVDGAGRTRWEYVRPSEGETPFREASLTEAKVRTSSLLKNLIAAVDAAGADLLATASPPIAKTNMDARVRHLRQALAEAAVNEKVQLLNDYYAMGETRGDPHVTLIKSRFPSVPAKAIEQIITLAGSEELQQMAAWDFDEASQTKPIPLRIAEELRHYQRVVRLNRAYEGLYQDALATADTPRLVLATLETLPGWSDTVRIELREADVSGALIDSIGPQNAPQTKVVVKDDDVYQAFDDSGNELSHWGSVFDALQHALPDAERRAMARPSIHHGDRLREAIGASPVDRDVLASRLKMPALKPAFQSPMRLASGKVGYPLGGLRDWLRLGRSPESRVQELYPGYTAEQTEALLRSLGNGAVRELKRRKVELKMLRRDLDRWVATFGWRYEGNHRRQVPTGVREIAAEHIERCWRRQTRVVAGADGRRLGYELDLSGLNIGALPELTADFSHVGVLMMSDMGLTLDYCESFLSAFSSLKRLEMSRNRLMDIPGTLEGMRNLETLRLANNQIGLTRRSVEILQSLGRLKNLDLDNNLLERLPDFSRLPDLERLHLKNTGITAWPTGLRDQPLELIDLRDNGLTQVPDHLLDPPAERAHATARLNRVTLLQGNPLSEGVQQRMRNYWATVLQTRPEWAVLRLPEAFGFSAPVGPANMQQWLRDLPAGQLAEKKALWQSLADERHSGEFFELLHRLAASYQGLEDYPDLQARVWQMLEAMGNATDLRHELFDLAGRPACEDRAALSFSYLEIRLMIHNARALAVGKDEAATLVQLAKGLFRLDEVERIALKDIQRRRDAINARTDLTNDEKRENLALIEEVEVRLAYRVGLKDRLGLPGQPAGGVFLRLGDVTPGMLDAAANEVLALDDSPQQFQSLVGRDFWIDYLKQAHGASFQALNDTLIANQIELDEAKAAGTLEEADYISQSEALGLQHKIKEAELVQSLTRTELEQLPGSTDL